MPGFSRLTYAPRSDAPARPPLDMMRLAQSVLRDVPLPERLGRSPDQDEHVLRQSSYLSKVWEAYRLSVDEKEVLASFLGDVVLDRLDRSRRDLALLDIGCDDGQLTLQMCEPFSRMTLVEADAQSFCRLQNNVRQQQSQATRRLPDCRLVHDRFPCDGLGKGSYDLVMMLHILYYIPRDEWIQTVLAAYETLRSGGMLVAAYACDEAAIAELLGLFGGRPLRFGEFEDACHLALPKTEIEVYRMTSVVCAMEEDGLAHLLGFLMADYQATGTAEQLRAYARRFRRMDRSYVWKKTDGAIIVRNRA